MPLAPIPGFLGPSAQSRSPQTDLEGTWNYYAEIPAGTPKAAPALFNTPGRRVYATLIPLGDYPGGIARGIYTEPDSGRCFVVSVNALLELSPTGGILNLIGPVVVDATPATFASNGEGGHQMLVVTGGHAYVLDLNTNVLIQLTAVTNGFQPEDTAACCDFSDGYAFVLERGTNKYYLCALEDMTTWDPLDVAQRSIAADVWQRLIINQRLLWLLGSITSEVWYDTGDLFPYAPIQGVFTQQGTGAAFSVSRADNTLLFLGQDEFGIGIFARLDGYTPLRISTHTQERLIQGLTPAQIAATIGWTYQEEGHLFYVLDAPGLLRTPTYDLTTKLWTDRAIWTGDTPGDPNVELWDRHTSVFHAFAFGKHLVGDRAAAAIYDQALAYPDEAL